MTSAVVSNPRLGRKLRPRSAEHRAKISARMQGNQQTRRHGESTRTYRSPEHTAWQAMRGRCNNPKHPRYADWGGRGITICARWDVYENFLADMGRRPSARHSLDRVDNDGNYEPGNCRWALPAEQVANRRRRSAA